MSVHETWLRDIKNYQAELLKLTGVKFELPPPTLDELKLEYLDIQPGKSMKAKVPFQKRFTNPVGLYQGGMLSACLDEVFGPLSYITAERPCMTLSMNVTYLKAFDPSMSHCLIEATVLRKTKTLIFMRAEVTSLQGDLLAHAETHVTMMRDDQLLKAKV